MPEMKTRWDIFCTVVDNFGDIGVTWRLARQLVAEHGATVRLWVDDLRAFERLCPQIDINAAQQWQQGVEVRQWSADWQPTEAADVVIAAFACQLPSAYMEAMAEREKPPLWMNLDYLSAEDWVVGCHGLPSVKYKNVQKFFFFPGFRKGTGGLLRESGLLEQRRQFQQSPQAQREFLQGLGIDRAPNAQLISLFAYENTGLASWLDTMTADSTPTHLLVPEGRILGDVERWLGVDGLKAGAVHVRDALTVQVLPFVRQDQYDLLLWSCDFNAVRGEDSFVRAQWAGRPLLWHIYRQDEDIHLDKLDAFLALYTQGLSEPAREAISGLWRAWNAGETMTDHWKSTRKHWPELEKHAETWCLEQALQADLAAALVQFYLNWI
ncbi:MULTISPECIES: elongation factor P maturation arginine rhamnosyltransferase EarP [Gammaproteobacteria]|uniref:elongation factor P maturation arginine rhamnosyltransferase EarP n=1 Tax=Gammaproteobacteria TaxID=1236 RepID=UPI001912B911|nr:MULTISPECIES: elongation factor P maturation arginine rhamnosyltransferase EarP [Gammaproteobacteria]MBK5304875.1 elongation factor P maturation arginine rhamnosyltransferase EarP [Bacillus sp. TH86]MBK5324644.1 elongation factor P maturation arginine rhamnosyltransferase EarP [Bacillus sp. TH59]MBK5339594.1 elongation factor P maturation arginine rhamnosyltransferase EarP [Bacillus sp. TH57]MBK5313640.1 elongation factor P maturation arginine rhamnosyltransferase EarP [Pseudomonas sp. TH71]